MSKELKRLNGFGNFDKFGGYYDAEDVDTLLSKKDMEIFNLKEELSYIKADSTFDRDKNKELLKLKDAEIRKLRRALWLARAERAIAESEYWYGHCSGMYYINAMEVPDEEDNPYKRVKDTNIGWYKTWMKVERKCRAKAEEYK